jgi:heme-degrading monooxygenase HmoA
MASHTKTDSPNASAVLLRDREKPNRFVSSGPWDSVEQVQPWRACPAFREGVAMIGEFLDGFEPHTMDPVVTIVR